MGNITNLATTGNYAAEKNGMAVSFEFSFDPKTGTLERITSGRCEKNGELQCTFTMTANPDLTFWHVKKGQGAEAVAAVDEAIAQLEANVAANGILSI